MGWYPRTYPTSAFMAARPFYRLACDWLRRLGPQPVGGLVAERTWQRRIGLIDLSIARSVTILWDLDPLSQADPHQLPTALRVNPDGSDTVLRELFAEFCRQLRDTRFDDYAGGIWEYELAESGEDDAEGDSASSQCRDAEATARARRAILADAWHWLHEADEFDLCGSFGGYGEWRGGWGNGTPPPEIATLAWDTPSRWTVSAGGRP